VWRSVHFGLVAAGLHLSDREHSHRCAAGLGLGAVFLGCHGRAEREQPIRQVLGIPEEIGLASVLCISHPAEEKEPRTQYDPARVHRNKW